MSTLSSLMNYSHDTLPLTFTPRTPYVHSDLYSQEETKRQSARNPQQAGITCQTAHSMSQLWEFRCRPSQWEIDSIKQLHLYCVHQRRSDAERVKREEGVYIEFLDLKRRVEILDDTARDWDVNDDWVLLDLAELLMVKWIEESRTEGKDTLGLVTERYMSDEDLQMKVKGLRVVCDHQTFRG